MMVVSAIQMTSTDNREQNIKKAIRYITESAENGANIVALPENFSYLRMEGDPFPFAESITGELVQTFSDLAKKHKIYIIMGSFPEKIEGSHKTYNTCLAINPKGKTIGYYRKVHLFDYGLNSDRPFIESKLVEKGSETIVLDTEWGKIGLAICYDLRFPELFRSLSQKGAKYIFIPSAFTMQTGKDHWELLLRARAVENLCYVVAPNQYGWHSSHRVSYGHTMIVGPWGQPIVQAQDKEQYIIAHLDESYQDMVRQKLPCLNHIQDFLIPVTGS